MIKSLNWLLTEGLLVESSPGSQTSSFQSLAFFRGANSRRLAFGSKPNGGKFGSCSGSHLAFPSQTFAATSKAARGFDSPSIPSNNDDFGWKLETQTLSLALTRYCFTLSFTFRGGWDG